MPHLIIPDHWQRQPDFLLRIDRNNNLANGLVFDDPGLNFNIADDFGLVNREPDVIVHPNQGMVGDLVGRNFNGSSMYMRYASQISGPPLTIMALCTTANTTGEHYLLGIGSTTNGHRSSLMTNTAQIRFISANSGVLVYSSYDSISVGPVFHLTGVSTSDSSRKLYVNGIASTEETTSAPLTSISRIDVGSQGRPVQYYWNGNLGIARLWNRALQEDEIVELYRAPWQIYYRDLRTVYFIPSASQVITPGKGSISIAGYSPAVSQPNTITIGKGDISIAGYSPAVSQPNTITIGKGDISIAGYSPAISQPNVITLSKGDISITGYSPAINQGAGQVISLETGHLSITGYAVTVSQPQIFALQPGHIVYTGHAPTVIPGQLLGAILGSRIISVTPKRRIRSILWNT